MLVSALVACSAPPPTAKQTTLTFAAPESERAIYEPLIAAFHEMHPELAVQFVGLDSAYTTADAAQAADTAVIAFFSGDDPSRHLFLDLEPYFAAEPTFSSDIYPLALALARSDAGMRHIPQTLTIPLLGYHRDLWNAQGLKPQLRWTWSDLLDAAEQLASSQNAEEPVVGLLDDSNGMRPLEGLLRENGIEVTVPASALDQPALYSAVQRVTLLVQRGAISSVFPTPTAQVSVNDVADRIKAGTVATWPAEWLPNNDSLFPVGIALEPGLNIGLARSYVISAGTEQPDAAWRWLTFLSQQDHMVSAGAGFIGQQLPVRRGLAATSLFWEQLDDPNRGVIANALERTSVPAVLPSSYRQALRQALNAVLDDGQSVETALRNAQRDLNQVAAQPPEPTAALPTVATPVPTADPGVATIVFNSWALDDPQLADVANQFMQANPDVAVRLQNDFLSIEGGMSLDGLATQTDCFAWISPPSVAQAQMLANLKPLMDADAAFPLNDVLSLPLARFQHNGAIYGLPHGLGLITLAYHPARFDAAGLSYPDASWTFADFEQTATRLTAAGGTQRLYGFSAPEATDLDRFLAAAGVQLYTGSGPTLRPTYTTPAVQGVVQRYIELVRTTTPFRRLYSYGPSSRFGSEEEDLRRDTGEVAMWLSYGLPRIKDPEAVQRTRPIANLGFAPPLLEGREMTQRDFFGPGLFVSAHTPHTQACWRWLAFLSGTTAGLGDYLPTRLSVGVSERFRAGANPELLTVYDASLPLLQRAPTARDQIEDWGNVFPDNFWFYRAVDRAIRGDNLEQELTEAQFKAEEYLSCAQVSGNPWECLRQADPQYGGWNQTSPSTP